MEEKPKERASRPAGVWVALGVAAALVMVSAFNVVRMRSRVSETKEVTAVVPVAVRAARMAVVEEALKTTGDLVPIQDIYLYPAVPGKKVQQVFFERGQPVPENALVVKLDDAEMAARLQ